MCGFGVQEKDMKETELLSKIYTRGCIPSIQGYVESNLYYVGGIALGVAFAQLLGKSNVAICRLRPDDKGLVKYVFHHREIISSIARRFL
jgi:hypothetical protein